jgi:hypothetical protein
MNPFSISAFHDVSILSSVAGLSLLFRSDSKVVFDVFKTLSKSFADKLFFSANSAGV